MRIPTNRHVFLSHPPLPNKSHKVEVTDSHHALGDSRANKKKKKLNSVGPTDRVLPFSTFLAFFPVPVFFSKIKTKVQIASAYYRAALCCSPVEQYDQCKVQLSAGPDQREIPSRGLVGETLYKIQWGAAGKRLTFNCFAYIVRPRWLASLLDT